MSLVSDLQSKLSSGISTQFQKGRSVMSWGDYLGLVVESPTIHIRNAAKYFADVIDHFSSYEKKLAVNEYTRYKLFDAEFDGFDGQVLGHERVQENIVRHIRNFVRSGRVDRLILLHGPNGSAKTSLVHALTRAAEIYSEIKEGALYRINWVFPTKKASGGALGFGGEASIESETFAYLKNHQIEARIICERREHPLLLLPKDHRVILFRQLQEQNSLPSDYTIPDVLTKGDLSAKNRRIFDALLTSYHGDVEQVFRHVQVERFYLSRRYRRGIVAVEAQMSVDAYARPISLDNPLSSVPPSLQHLTLFETGGALTDGNRGLIEYSDLLKRPIESWKYLLVACEHGQASLDVVSIFFDSLLLASSNELHLNSFREYPDWQSFKGRFELVNVPYLLRFSDELKIYQNQIPKALVGEHIAPHALELAARWAVLTRLEPPRPESYQNEIRDLIRSISALEKLEFYDKGTLPSRLTQKEGRELRQVLPKLYTEFEGELDYEGRYGASPREIRTLLLNAAQDRQFDHLSPIAVLEGLRSLVKDKSSYDFLRREPQRGYKDAQSFVDVVEQNFRQTLTEEIRGAMGLVGNNSHRELFERYVKNISAWTKGEKLQGEQAGTPAAPDAELMSAIERVLLASGESYEDFRRSLISQIGAYRLEHPDLAVDYDVLFASYLKRLKDDYYGKQQKLVNRIQNAFLKVLDRDDKGVKPEEIEQVGVLRKNLADLGYNDSSARQAVAYLQKQA